jgi:hypothetical protein
VVGQEHLSKTPDARVTEMVNGLLVSKPAKKEPEVIDLQEYAESRTGSISGCGINKIKAIHVTILVHYSISP